MVSMVARDPADRTRGVPWSVRSVSLVPELPRPGGQGPVRWACASGQLVAEGLGVDQGPDLLDAAIPEAVEDVLGELDAATGRGDAQEFPDRGAVEPEPGGDGVVAGDQLVDDVLKVRDGGDVVGDELGVLLDGQGLAVADHHVVHELAQVTEAALVERAEIAPVDTFQRFGHPTIITRA